MKNEWVCHVCGEFNTTDYFLVCGNCGSVILEPEEVPEMGLSNKILFSVVVFLVGLHSVLSLMWVFGGVL